MIILQLTNTRASDPETEARAILADAQALADAGHEVTLVSPAEDRATLADRIPRFIGAALRPAFAAVSALVEPALAPPAPELVHVHHPFLVGEEALRIAALHDAPLVFTATLRYENPFPLPAAEADHLRAFIEKLGICFANRCDFVVAPSAAVAVRLFEGGVLRPIHVVSHDDPPGLRAARLAKIYDEACANRRARGPVRDTAPAARLRRDLALAWHKIHPAATPPPRRTRGVFALLRDGSALPC